MSLFTRYRPQSGAMARVRQPAMTGGLLGAWDERISEHDQQRFEAHGEIDPLTAFVGPDSVVYRRNEDSDESLAARIRRGFETAVGGYDRSDPV